MIELTPAQIKDSLYAKNITQQQIADIAGVRPQTVCQVIAGNRTSANITKVILTSIYGELAGGKEELIITKSGS